MYSFSTTHDGLLRKVNGKVRAELELCKTATEDDARRLAEVLPQVCK